MPWSSSRSSYTLTLRSILLAVAAITPLIVGALWTFGIMHLFGVDLNLANTIFLPLVIGGRSRIRRDHS